MGAFCLGFDLWSSKSMKSALKLHGNRRPVKSLIIQQDLQVSTRNDAEFTKVVSLNY